MARGKAAQWIGSGLYVLGCLVAVLLFLAAALVSFVRFMEGPMLDALAFAVLAAVPGFAVWGFAWLARWLLSRL